jgi:hypothetical protein
LDEVKVVELTEAVVAVAEVGEDVLTARESMLVVIWAALLGAMDDDVVDDDVVAVVASPIFSSVGSRLTSSRLTRFLLARSSEALLSLSSLFLPKMSSPTPFSKQLYFRSDPFKSDGEEAFAVEMCGVVVMVADVNVAVDVGTDIGTSAEVKDAEAGVVAGSGLVSRLSSARRSSIVVSSSSSSDRLRFCFEGDNGRELEAGG